MTGEPPSDAGPAHDRITWALPRVAISPVGAPGTVTGTADTAADGRPWPAVLTAATLKKYVVPLVRPARVTAVPVTLVTGALPDRSAVVPSKTL